MAYEFEMRAIYPWYLVIAVVVSFITLAVGLGVSSVVERYGIIVYPVFGILILFTLSILDERSVQKTCSA